MTNQTVQATNSVSKSTSPPLKKMHIEKIMPSNRTSDDLMLLSKNKNERLLSLQKEAYFNVLQAFSAESPTISNERILIVKDLKDELHIPHYTHTAYEKKIKNDPVVQQLWEVLLTSDEKEKLKVIAAEERKITAEEDNPLKIRNKLKKAKGNGIDPAKMQNDNGIAPAKMQNGNGKAPAKMQDGNVIAPAKIQDGNGKAPAKRQDGNVIAPAKIQEEKAQSSSTSDNSPVPSWGQISPESLVGKSVSIKMPGEDVHIAFFIRFYDSEKETHYLETASCQKEIEDPCNWVDIRHIPTEDIIWPEGNPGLPEHKCFLKPGNTLLQETSTTRVKTQLKEVGKTSTGIPIIKRIDKGKAIAEG